MSRKPRDFADYPADLAQRATLGGPYRGVIQAIVDGDTVIVLLDLGFNTYGCHSLRIAGIDAPELFSGTDRARGQTAKALLEGLAPVGTPCLVTTEKDRQTFGRYVATLTLPDGSDLATRLVELGAAGWSAN